MNTPRPALRTFLLASALVALAYAPTASAAPYNWTGADNGTWNTTTNWSGSLVPGINDDLTILGPLNVAGALTINFDGTTNNAKSLNFTNTAATSVLSTTGGKTLVIGAGGITSGAGAVQIGANSGNSINIELNASQAWNVGAGGLTVTNYVGGSGFALTKTGAGNLTFNTGAANGFNGGLNANGGTLTLNYGNLATPTNLIAPTNALQINSGALTITGKNVAAATTAQTFAGATFGAGRNTVNIAKGASATSATLNLGILTANTGSATTFSPTTAWTTTASTTERVFISAGGSVPALPGAGTTAFVEASVFHRVAAGANGSLRLAGVNEFGQLFLKANAGNLAVGTGVDPTGSYQLNAGSIALTNTGASVYGLLLNATSAGVNITVANSGTLTLNSVIQIKATESVAIVPGTGVSNVVIGAERNLVIAMDNAAAFSITAPIVNNGGGASGVTIVGTAPTGTPGVVTLSGVNTFSGQLSVVNNQLNIGSINNASANGVLGNSALSVILGAGNGVTGTLGYTGATGTSNKKFTLATGGTGAFTVPSPNVLTLNGEIDGGGNLSKTNTGTLILGGTNIYTGITTVSAGTLQIDAATALPSGSQISLPKNSTNTGTLKLNTSGTNVYNNTFANFQSSNGLVNGGTPNIQNVQGSNEMSGNMTITAGGGNGVNIQSDAGLLTISGNLINGGGSARPFSFGGAGNGVFSGVMSESTGTTGIIKSGAGTWSVTGTTSSFTSGVSVLDGVLNVASVAVTGSNSSIGAGGPINLTGQGTSGTFQYTGSAAVTTDHALSVAATGGTLDASGTGSGTLKFTGAFTASNPSGTNLSYINGSNVATNLASVTPGTVGGGVMSVTAAGLLVGTTITSISGNSYTLSNPFTGTTGAVASTFGTDVARTLTLTGSNTGDNEISSNMGDASGGGVLSITKTGAGTWILSGTNAYSGQTLVNAGILAVNGSLTGPGTTTVTSATLKGSGLITGPVTIGTGGTLAPGNSIESLGGGALTLNNGSTFEQEIKDNTAAGADLFYSSGTLSLSGTVTLNLINIPDPYAWQPNDKVTLISYSGTPSLLSKFTYAPAPGGDLDEGDVFTYDGAQWSFKYEDTTPGENYKTDALLTGTKFVTMTVVPEAGTAGLLALGLLLLLRLRRR